jgi:hypothetical protein
MPRVIILFVCLFLPLSGFTQERDPYALVYPDSLKKGRAWGLGAGSAALWIGSTVGLNAAWYAKEPQSAFHSFDDSGEWLQLDKMGHMTTAYTIGYHYMDIMRWTGANKNWVKYLGGSMGTVFLTSIEILDGFSTAWGFSWSDMGANALGSGILIGQEALWGEQRIKLRISYSPSGLAKYRPNLLGSGIAEEMLKDYNAQTYWVSANIHSFIPNQESRFPRWLNVAVGYGGQNMLGAFSNPAVDSEGHALPQLERYRQFYFSLDFDLTRIRTKSRVLRSIFRSISIIKIPFPAVEFNKNGVKFHPFFF